MDKSGNPKEKVNSLYKKMVLLNEGMNRKDPHSETWKEFFNELIEFSKEYAEKNWDGYTKKFQNKEYEPVYYEFDYKNAVGKILKYFVPGKLVESREKNGQYEIQFWDYYISTLYMEIRRYATDLKVKKLNSKRAFSLTAREQRAINKMSRIWKIYQKKNPETKLKFYSEDMIQLYLEEKAAGSKEAIQKILEKNRISLNVENFGNENELSSVNTGSSAGGNEEGDSEELYEDITIDEIDFKEKLMDALEFIDKVFKSFINLKIQEEQAQKEKTEFMKELLTCFYLNVFVRKFSYFSTEEIASVMEKRGFFSWKIYKEFLKKDERLKKDEDMKNIKIHERRWPPNLEWISLNHGKPKNYGNRRLHKFKELLRDTFETAQESEIKDNAVLKFAVYSDLNAKSNV